MRRPAPLAFLLLACGGTGGSMPTRETWVADRLLVPTTSIQATSYGFDLDGDGPVDNQLGNVFVALVQAGGSGTLDFQGAVDAAVLTGATVQLVETQTGAATSVAFRTGTPAVAPCTDPLDLATCGHHLGGTTTFTAAAPARPALAGSGTSAAFQAGPGQAVLQVPLFGGPTVALPLLLARASFSRSGAALEGKVGGAIPLASVDSLLIPALYGVIATAVARDCPGGTCTPGSTGATLLALFDADHDGTVTLAEVQTNALIATLLAPDVDTDGDHTADALSVGFGYHLVGAVF